MMCLLWEIQACLYAPVFQQNNSCKAFGDEPHGGEHSPWRWQMKCWITNILLSLSPKELSLHWTPAAKTLRQDYPRFLFQYVDKLESVFLYLLIQMLWNLMDVNTMKLVISHPVFSACRPKVGSIKGGAQCFGPFPRQRVIIISFLTVAKEVPSWG